MRQRKEKSVLFLCTGNYYRSRFAEILFNFTGFDDRLDRIAWELHFSESAFGHDLALYQELVHARPSGLFQAVDYLRATVSNTVYDMKRELALLEPSDGNKLEAYMEKFLRLCFSPAYEELDLRPQAANRGGISIRDFIIANISSRHAFLATLERKGVELLLFDAKNYSSELTTSDLDAFRRYLGDNNKFGDFGIILSRRGVSANCDEHLYRSLIGKGPIILVLGEEDLMAMLDRFDQHRHPVDFAGIEDLGFTYAKRSSQPPAPLRRRYPGHVVHDNGGPNSQVSGP
jgi:hypothetical protein